MPKEVGRKAGRVSRARSLKAWVLGFGGLWMSPVSPGALPPWDACRVPSVPAAWAQGPGSLPAALPTPQGQKRSASLGHPLIQPTSDLRFRGKIF